jgi:hypothetical protein
MKKLLLITFIALGALSPQLRAQCTIDTSPTTPGLYPDSLEWACVGQMYDQTITLVFANDTTISVPPLPPLAVNFLTYKITSIQNLPAGLSYACDNSNCEWTITQNQINRGCVRFTGTPTAVFSGDLIVTVEAVVDNPLVPATPVDVPTPFTVQSAADCNTTSQQHLITAAQMHLYPNPGTEGFTFTADNISLTDLKVMDMTGRIVYEQNLDSGAANYSIAVSANSWNKGIYIVRTSGIAGVNTFRWILN